MNLVINRTDALGDLLLSLPVARAFKRTHPDARIAFLVAPRCAPLLEGNPDINEVWLWDTRVSLWGRVARLRRRLREFGAEAFLHLGGSQLPGFCAWAAGVPAQAGLLSRWPSFLFLNQGTRQSRRLAQRHESDYNLALLAPLGVSPPARPEDYAPSLHLAPQEVEAAWTDFPDHSRPLIVVHPGMSGHARNWPGKSYAQLIQELDRRRPGERLYLIGHTPADAPWVEEVRRHLSPGDNVIYFNGATKGLRHYMALISRAACVIAPSTGIGHIANALGVPQVGLYSPIRVQAAPRWRPFWGHPNCRILSPQVNCPQKVKCSGQSCPDYDCMASISVQTVADQVEELLCESSNRPDSKR